MFKQTITAIALAGSLAFAAAPAFAQKGDGVRHGRDGSSMHKGGGGAAFRGADGIRGGRIAIHRGKDGRFAGGRRNWDGNRWAGGGRNWHRGRHHHGWRGRGYGYGFYGVPFIGSYYAVPYAYSSYGAHDECYQLQRVATPYGLRWRQVWLCD